MAYDLELADGVRKLLSRRTDITEKKMFGSLCFMLAGNLCLGLWKDALIVRVGSDAYEDLLAEDDVREFDVTGRPMRGWLLVEPEGVESAGDLKRWVDLAVQFAATLPEKDSQPERVKSRRKK